MDRYDLNLSSLFGIHGTYHSAEAFAGLYERTNQIVFRYIYALNGEPQEDVEDIWLETYFRAWRSRHRFTGTEQAGLGWLLKIARNLVIDHHRQRSRRPVAILLDAEREPAASDDEPENQVIANEQYAALWQSLDTLSDQQREIVVLRYIIGWRVNEIAHHLQMAENTVSVTLNRALKKLSGQQEE